MCKETRKVYDFRDFSGQKPTSLQRPTRPIGPVITSNPPTIPSCLLLCGKEDGLRIYVTMTLRDGRREVARSSANSTAQILNTSTLQTSFHSLRQTPTTTAWECLRSAVGFPWYTDGCQGTLAKTREGKSRDRQRMGNKVALNKQTSKAHMEREAVTCFFKRLPCFLAKQQQPVILPHFISFL